MTTIDDLDVGGVSLRIRAPNGGYRSIKLDVFNIDPTKLSEEFAKQASLYAFFSSAVAVADREAATADAKMKQMYAQTDLAWREGFAASGVKATEGQVAANVAVDPEYIAAQKVDIDCDYDLKVLKAITDAMKIRSEMLISLGAHLRAELDVTGMRMKENQFESSVDAARQRIAAAKKNSG